MTMARQFVGRSFVGDELFVYHKNLTAVLSQKLVALL